MVRVAILAAVMIAVAMASESPAPDWARALAPNPERPLLRQVVIEHRADAWLIAHRAEVLAAVRAGSIDSSVAIVAAEVLLARAELTFGEALDLHALLVRLHGTYDTFLANHVLLQWLSWLPPEADDQVVWQGMAERGWQIPLENLKSLRAGRARERARRLANGEPIPTQRDVIVTSGALYGTEVWLAGGLTVGP